MTLNDLELQNKGF